MHGTPLSMLYFLSGVAYSSLSSRRGGRLRQPSLPFATPKWGAHQRRGSPHARRKNEHEGEK